MIEMYLRIALVLCTVCASLATEAPEIVHIPDPALKAAIEDALWVADPTPEDMLELTSFTCTHSYGFGVEDLTGLEYAKNLRRLILSYNSITDLGPLANLKQLDKLVFNHNYVSDLSPLATITTLKHLDMHRNKFRNNLEPLGSLRRLNTLVIRENHISDLGILADLPRLSYLDISENDICDISILVCMYDLRELSLRDNFYLQDISPLSSLNTLQRLELDDCDITSVSDLTGLTNLEMLDLGGNDLDEDSYCSALPAIASNNPGIDMAYPINRRPPRSVSASRGSYAGGVKVSWHEVCNGPNYTTYYRVCRANSQGESPTPISDWVTDLSFVDTSPFQGGGGTLATELADISGPFAPIHQTLYVDNDAADSNVRDPDVLGTPGYPFHHIQDALDIAGDGATVIVRPGTYTGPIDFLGKSISLMGYDPYEANGCTTADYPVIQGRDGEAAVQFVMGEDSNTLLTGFVIIGGRDVLVGAIDCRNSSPVVSHCLIVGTQGNQPNSTAIRCVQSQALFTNCTIADNLSYGITMMMSHVHLANSILWNNRNGDINSQSSDNPQLSYCNIEDDWLDESVTIISQNPLFATSDQWDTNDVQPSYHLGDYHLQSEAGCWNPETQTWIQQATDSPCIDAGDPGLEIDNEPLPHGGRVNLGAYGGTCVASKSFFVPGVYSVYWVQAATSSHGSNASEYSDSCIGWE